MLFDQTPVIIPIVPRTVLVIASGNTMTGFVMVAMVVPEVTLVSVVVPIEILWRML